MKFVYTPEGAAPQKWPWQADKMLNTEIEQIEILTRMDYPAWEAAVDRGNMRAVHALLFTLLRRETPTLKYSEVVFTASECNWELEHDEKVALLAEMEAKEADLPPAEREVLADLRQELAGQIDAAARAVEAGEHEDDDSDPKAPAAMTTTADPPTDPTPPASAPTSGTSPTS